MSHHAGGVAAVVEIRDHAGHRNVVHAGGGGTRILRGRGVQDSCLGNKVLEVLGLVLEVGIGCGVEDP